MPNKELSFLQNEYKLLTTPLYAQVHFFVISIVIIKYSSFKKAISLGKLALDLVVLADP
jgi:hypothetical protein